VRVPDPFPEPLVRVPPFRAAVPCVAPPHEHLHDDRGAVEARHAALHGGPDDDPPCPVRLVRGVPYISDAHGNASDHRWLRGTGLGPLRRRRSCTRRPARYDRPAPVIAATPPTKCHAGPHPLNSPTNRNPIPPSNSASPTPRSAPGEWRRRLTTGSRHGPGGAPVGAGHAVGVVGADGRGAGEAARRGAHGAASPARASASRGAVAVMLSEGTGLWA